ncbi:MAG: RHS repeat-associated core domain-containing protein [Bacillota bacterium]
MKTFDAIGNPVWAEATASAEPQATAADLASDGTVDSTMLFAYDANGSTTEEKTVDSQGATVSDKRYVWDVRNHLVGLDANGDGDLADAGDATFTYDSDGLRVGSHVVGGDTTTVLLDQNNPTGYAQILEERVTHADSSSDLISYLIGQTVLGQAKDAGPVQYLLADGHGSTRLLVHTEESTGNLVIDQTMNYDAYGNAVGFDASTAQTHVLYTNQVFDPIMQQYVLRSRYYNQAIGEFSSFDFGYAGDPFSPQTLHKYLYCHGDPINGIDPYGMFEIAEVMTNMNSVMGNFASIVSKAQRVYSTVRRIIDTVDTLSSIVRIVTGDMSALLYEARSQLTGTSLGKYAGVFTTQGISKALTTLMTNLSLITTGIIKQPEKLKEIGGMLDGDNPALIIKMPTPPLANPLALIPPIRTGLQLGRLKIPVYLSFQTTEQTGRFIGLAVAGNCKTKHFDTRVAELFHMDYIVHGGSPGPNNWARWDSNGFEFQIPRKR